MEHRRHPVRSADTIRCLVSDSFGPIASGTRIGHVHLKVADLDRALAFYVGVLVFSLMTPYGDPAAFFPAAAIITTSVSPPGKARVARRPRLARQASFIPQFF